MKLIEDGREPPPQFFEQQSIPEHLSFYWQAFLDLSSERQIGMGVGSIPRSAIVGYANEHRIFARDQIDNFYQIVRMVDDEYVMLANTSKARNLVTEVAASDVQGAKQVLTNLQNRAAAKRNPKRG